MTVCNVELRCDLNITPWCIDIESYQAMQNYIVNKDVLVKHSVYKTASNGSYIRIGERMATPKPPMNIEYFVNLFNTTTKAPIANKTTRSVPGDL